MSINRLSNWRKWIGINVYSAAKTALIRTICAALVGMVTVVVVTAVTMGTQVCRSEAMAPSGGLLDTATGEAETSGLAAALADADTRHTTMKLTAITMATAAAAAMLT